MDPRGPRTNPRTVCVKPGQSGSHPDRTEGSAREPRTGLRPPGLSGCHPASLGATWTVRMAARQSGCHLDSPDGCRTVRVPPGQSGWHPDSPEVLESPGARVPGFQGSRGKRLFSGCLGSCCLFGYTSRSVGKQQFSWDVSTTFGTLALWQIIVCPRDTHCTKPSSSHGGNTINLIVLSNPNIS